ncbi:hypothetical protein P0R31_36965 [Bradyrhizobium yuanmingense]|uniref:hypothetical protein n=1 Tax=Bradyrhizobium yuanmingense TaxID=108015 RepID=UPI0023B92FF0|nr:hypothetical protein [Bradyrhizobium yuanmingense]MDF0522830.1 hypothetical protein [Bradyrhizobium yuanmingense]
MNDIKTKHPEKAGQVNQLQKTMKRQQGAEQQAVNQAEQAQAQTASAQAAKSEAYNALNGPPAESAARSVAAAPAP